MYLSASYFMKRGFYCHDGPIRLGSSNTFANVGWSRVSRVLWYRLKFSTWSGCAFADERIDTETFVVALLLNVICVANLVHNPLSRGKGRSVIPSSTELFPLYGLSATD